MNPWKGLGALPRDVWIIFTANLINRAGTMVLPFLVLYLTRSLGFSAGRAASVVTAYGIGSLIVGPISGRLSDRMGPIAILEGSLFLSGLLVMLIPLAGGYVSILLLVFAWATTAEAFRPASMSLLTGLAGPGHSRLAVSVMRLAINLGLSVGPAVGGFLAMYSFPALFIVDGITSLLAGLVLVLSQGRRPVAEPASPVATTTAGALEGAGATSIGRLGMLSDRRLIYFLLALLPAIMVFFQLQTAVPLYIVHYLRMPEAAYGLMFTLNTMMVILIEVPLSSATSHWPHRMTLPLGAFLVGAGFGSMGLARTYLGLAVSVVIWTFGEMILLPTASAYVVDISPSARRGEYLGLYTMSFSLAFTVAPWLGATALEALGPGVLWGCAFALGCLSAALMARVSFRSTAPSPGSV